MQVEMWRKPKKERQKLKGPMRDESDGNAVKALQENKKNDIPLLPHIPDLSLIYQYFIKTQNFSSYSDSCS